MSDKMKKVLYWIAGVAVAIVAGITAFMKYVDTPVVEAPEVVVVDSVVAEADTLVVAVDSVAVDTVE